MKLKGFLFEWKTLINRSFIKKTKKTMSFLMHYSFSSLQQWHSSEVKDVVVKEI